MTITNTPKQRPLSGVWRYILWVFASAPPRTRSRKRGGSAVNACFCLADAGVFGPRVRTWATSQGVVSHTRAGLRLWDCCSVRAGLFSHDPLGLHSSRREARQVGPQHRRRSPGPNALRAAPSLIPFYSPHRQRLRWTLLSPFYII